MTGIVWAHFFHHRLPTPPWCVIGILQCVFTVKLKLAPKEMKKNSSRAQTTSVMLFWPVLFTADFQLLNGA